MHSVTFEICLLEVEVDSTSQEGSTSLTFTCVNSSAFDFDLLAICVLANKSTKIVLPIISMYDSAA